MDIELKKFNSFRIESKSDFFQKIKTEKELLSLINKAKKEKLKIIPLGAGSNVLFKKKVKSALLKIDNKEIKIKNNKIIVSAGLSLANLLNKCLKNNLSGLEWAIGIPGTVGGAIFGNAGAFSQSISNFVEEVESIDIETGRKIIRKNKECYFDYRQSIFQKKKEIIWRAVLKLKKEKKKKIERKMKEFLEKRKKSQPIGSWSAGSIFKNVPLDRFPKKIQKELKKIFPQKKLIPTGYLIEKTGLKGKTIGGAQISKKHANFIINTGKAETEDIEKLINLIKKEVLKKFKVKLEKEIRIIS